MTDRSRWIIPSKFNGHSLKAFTWKWDTSLVRALFALADQETKEQHRKISVPTLAMNLMTGNGPYWNQKRAALKRHYKQLHKENQHVERTEEDTQDQAE